MRCEGEEGKGRGIPSLWSLVISEHREGEGRVPLSGPRSKNCSPITKNLNTFILSIQ